MYIKLTNGTPEQYSIRQLCRDNPNVSFPKEPTLELLASYGVRPYTRPNPIEHDGLAWRLIDDDFVEVNGAWMLPYKLEVKPQADAEANVRSYRGNLLAESDWIVTKSIEVGQSIPADWAAYRQALRDVTTQEGFPYSVAWPTKPE